jgi:hypothetical protein
MVLRLRKISLPPQTGQTAWRGAVGLAVICSPLAVHATFMALLSEIGSIQDQTVNIIANLAGNHNAVTLHDVPHQLLISVMDKQQKHHAKTVEFS